MSLQQSIKFDNIFAMPNKETFKIKPIAELLYQETNNEYLDAFPYPYSGDFLDKARKIQDNSVKNVAYDPPYSPRQLAECYKGLGQSWDGRNSVWSQWEYQIARIVQPGGKCIKFGWNTHLVRSDFEVTRILLVNHGSHHNDTIVTVQRKMNKTLDDMMENVS